MGVRKVSRLHVLLFGWLLALLFAFPLRAQTELRGKIVDPLGAPISGAKIVLLQSDKEIARALSDTQGSFTLSIPASGRYIPQVEAAGFATQTLDPIFLSSGKSENITVALRIGPLPQQIVVSATGT